MSKILFFVAILLVASIAADSTTLSPLTSTADPSHQKPAVIADAHNPSHDTHRVQKREDSHIKPAVIADGAQTPDHNNNTSNEPHSVQKREDSHVNPAVIAAEAESPDHQNNTSNEPHSIQKREDSHVNPAVITAGAESPDNQTNAFVQVHSVKRREESQVKPAVIAVGAETPHHQNNTSNDEHAVEKREDSPLKPPVVHDLTFSTLRPTTGGVSASTQHPSDNQHNTGNACVQIYEPVCGSDGKTYSNLCMLNLATKVDPAIVLAKKGEC